MSEPPWSNCDTPEFTTLETFTITGRGTVHVVENTHDVDPSTLIEKVVLLDGELRKVTAFEAHAVHWRPGMKAFRHIGLMVRGIK